MENRCIKTGNTNNKYTNVYAKLEEFTFEKVVKIINKEIWKILSKKLNQKHK